MIFNNGGFVNNTVLVNNMSEETQTTLEWEGGVLSATGLSPRLSHLFILFSILCIIPGQLKFTVNERDKIME